MEVKEKNMRLNLMIEERVKKIKLKFGDEAQAEILRFYGELLRLVDKHENSFFRQTSLRVRLKDEIKFKEKRLLFLFDLLEKK